MQCFHNNNFKSYYFLLNIFISSYFIPLWRTGDKSYKYSMALPHLRKFRAVVKGHSGTSLPKVKTNYGTCIFCERKPSAWQTLGPGGSVLYTSEYYSGPHTINVKTKQNKNTTIFEWAPPKMSTRTRLQFKNSCHQGNAIWQTLWQNK